MVTTNITEVESSGRVIHGLSTDTKPSTAPTNSIFFETDTRRYFLWDGTYWVSLSYVTTSDRRKVGQYHGTATASGDGIFNGNMSAIAVGTGANSATTDSTGTYVTHDTAGTINSLAGVRLNARKMTRINNAYFKAAIKTGASIANTRIYCGLVADASAPASAADPLNAKEGVALWYDSAVNANWRRLHNDSAGASVSDDTTLAVGTSTIYTVEIIAVTDSKFAFNFNNAYTDITTDIPASTTTLAWWIYIENTTGASRTIQSRYAVCRVDI